ncbi:acyl-CoA thioesterase [Pseudooceanicola algae]|uniref:Thioesterase superfamily protein n=1 Tax=Pseudooceanicola algae TaxID=1537215 RepID=A0A418SAW9_9RHOB|nr:acyl-CoA thioesterase [Pseudooceanicola algae]QPM91262.1 hypothetical protein PSAL_025150 [Pseudooceanicola algae]
MYPYLRLGTEFLRYRKAPPLAITDTHATTLRILPGDIDPWRELNNGRTLTLYDLGRLPFAKRTGVLDLLKRQGWGLTVAGSAMRYRKRLTLFTRIELRTRLIGLDARFLYIEQSMWLPDGTCANAGVIRGAVIANRKMVPMAELREAVGPVDIPALPVWAEALFAAESDRPWPPETGAPIAS